MAGISCDSKPTFNSAGLSARARRLQEMVAERQANPSHYKKSPSSRSRPSLITTKTPALIESADIPHESRLNENGLLQPQQRRAMSPKKSFTDPLLNGANAGCTTTSSVFQPEAMSKERRRGARSYLGGLSGTRYLQQILAPLRGDSQSSAKEMLKLESGKQRGHDRCMNGDENSDSVCAVVVPSSSYAQVSVIKRKGQENTSERTVQNASNYGSPVSSSRIQAVTPGYERHHEMAGCSRNAENRPEDMYAKIRKKPKRFSLARERKSSRCDDVEYVIESRPDRPKSASLECQVGEDPEEEEEVLTLSRNEVPKLGAVKKLHKVSLLKFTPPSSSRNLKDNYAIGKSKTGHSLDDNVDTDTCTNSSARRPLLTITNEVVSSPVGVVSEPHQTPRPKQKHPSQQGRSLRDIDEYRKVPPPVNGMRSYSKSTKDSSPNGETTSSADTRKRGNRLYSRSHTTSTYSGRYDKAPDASTRRHLIGFLHRTSHLSLTSELSADASFYLIGHRGGRRFEDSTIGSESDARIFSDDDDRSRVSTSTDITSVSRQHQANAYRKRRNRRKFRQPSRASSFSSITESSMSLDVITVTLNMDTVNFLGISIVGQSSSRGDNGIYVANIMKGGAVALDGRIEPGDMILQVNDISFENFTNDQAVDVLRESVARRGPIKLTVAKMWDGGPRSAFTVPRQRDEPVRPIDTQAWIQHTNAMRGMPSILEGSEGAPTPVPGQYGRPPSSSTVTSNGSAPNTVVAGAHIRLDTATDKKKIVQMMVMPNSGLDIKNRTWLKIPIPMSFLGSDLVDWLMEHVDGLRDRKDGRKFAGELLKDKLISHVVNKITFTEQCYYILGDECAEFARLRQNPPSGDEQGVRSEVGSILPPPPPGLMAAAQQQQAGRVGWSQNAMLQNAPPSMVSGYASMPISPYPGQPQGQQFAPMLIAMTNQAAMYKTGAPDVHSQTSSNDGSSGSEHIRAGRAVLPPAPVSSLSTLSQHIQVGGSASLVAGPSAGHHQNRLDEMPQDLASSRQSFRIAMSQPFEFFVDNL